ncbi:ATP-binding protein [Thiovibrio sp. JS02]
MRFRLIFFSLVVLLFLTLTAGVLIYLNGIRKAAYTETAALVQDTANYFSDKINFFIAPARHGVKALAGEEASLALYREKTRPAAAAAAITSLRNYRNALNASLCYLLDKNGRIIAISDQDAPENSHGDSRATSVYFPEAVAGRVDTAVIVDPVTGGKGIYFSHPVFLEQEVVGVAVIKMSTADLDRLLANILGELALTDEHDTVLASSDNDWLFKTLKAPPPGKKIPLPAEKKPPARASAPLHVQFARNANKAVLPDGEEYLYHRSVVQGTDGWTVTYFYQASNLNRKFYLGIHRKVSYALAGITLLFFGTTIFLYRQANVAWREREHLDMKHRAASSFLAQIFNLATEGIRIIDNNFNVIKVNKSFCQMTGHSPDNIIGHKCYDNFWGPRCHTPECTLALIKAGKKRLEFEIVKEGLAGPLNCWVAAVPFVDANGKVLGVLETFRDISERLETEISMQKAFEDAHKMAEELAASHYQIVQQKKELEKAYDLLKQSQSQILQQEKMASIGQLAAGVAHEINNPMGFIASNLGTLGKYIDRLASYLENVEKKLREEKENSQELDDLRKKLKIAYILNDGRELVRESLDGAERIRKIVQGLKNFSRVDQAEKALADLNECIDSTVNIVWNDLKYKAEIIREYGDIPRTVCMPQQLNQVFMNLLLNAAQAIEEHGSITVKTWHDGKWIFASVSDTGKGIPQEHLTKIFDPFFTTKGVGSGTGLGLSIVYDIVVKNHKGDIIVASEEGKGATFTLRLPVVSTEDNA